MEKVCFLTLGCKVNSYESEFVRNLLLNEGYEEVEENADVCIINTCTVTNTADNKSKQVINNIKKNIEDRIKELIKDITSNTKFNINKLDVKKNTIILNITFFKSEEKQITEFIDIINKKYEIEEYSYEKLKEEIKIEEYDEL